MDSWEVSPLGWWDFTKRCVPVLIFWDPWNWSSQRRNVPALINPCHCALNNMFCMCWYIMTGRDQCKDIVSPGKINFGTRGSRKFARGHIVLGRPVTPPNALPVLYKVSQVMRDQCLVSPCQPRNDNVETVLIILAWLSSPLHSALSRGWYIYGTIANSKHFPIRKSSISRVLLKITQKLCRCIQPLVSPLVNFSKMAKWAFTNVTVA